MASRSSEVRTNETRNISLGREQHKVLSTNSKYYEYQSQSTNVNRAAKCELNVSEEINLSEGSTSAPYISQFLIKLFHPQLFKTWKLYNYESRSTSCLI